MTNEGAEEAAGLFCREGEYWTISYQGNVVRLRDAKGLRYLERLLRHPGRAFPVTELATAVTHSVGSPLCPCDPLGEDTAGSEAAERARKAVTNRIRQTVARIRAAHGPLGLHLGNTVHTGRRCAYTPERPRPWSDRPHVEVE